MSNTEFRNLQVGKTFTFRDKTLKVEEVDINECEGCFFYKNTAPDCEGILKEVAPGCASWARKDKKSVIFKEVKNDR